MRKLIILIFAIIFICCKQEARADGDNKLSETIENVTYQKTKQYAQDTCDEVDNIEEQLSSDIELDLKKIKNSLKKYSEKGCVKATYLLGREFYFGQFKKNLNKAEEYLLIAEKMGSIEAKYHLSILNFIKGDCNNGFLRLNDSSKLLNYAKLDLAYMLLYGKLFSNSDITEKCDLKDINRGVRLLSDLFKEGDLYAGFELAEIYYYGKIVSKDKLKAKELYNNILKARDINEYYGMVDDIMLRLEELVNN